MSTRIKTRKPTNHPPTHPPQKKKTYADARRGVVELALVLVPAARGSLLELLHVPVGVLAAADRLAALPAAAGLAEHAGPAAGARRAGRPRVPRAEVPDAHQERADAAQQPQPEDQPRPPRPPLVRTGEGDEVARVAGAGRGHVLFGGVCVFACVYCYWW